MAWSRGTRCNEVATSARVVVLGSVRACSGRRLINRRARAVPGLVRARVGLCQLINRRCHSQCMRLVMCQIKNFLKTNECYRISQVWGLTSSVALSKIFIYV